MSENTYTFPKIDVFRTAISSLLAPTGNNEQASFLVHQVPHTSATVLRYRRMFTQFSLRVSASEYTCRPIIANLLYNHGTTTDTCKNIQFIQSTLNCTPRHRVKFHAKRFNGIMSSSKVEEADIIMYLTLLGRKA